MTLSFTSIYTSSKICRVALKDKPGLWSLIKSYIFEKQTSVITFSKHDIKVSISVCARHLSTEGKND